MPLDPLSYGVNQHRFEQQAADETRPLAFQPRAQFLRVDNRARMWMALLALSSLRLPPDGSGHRNPGLGARAAAGAATGVATQPSPHIPAAVAAAPALLAGAHAGSANPYQPLSVPNENGMPSITSVANGVLAGCATQPSACGRTLAGGALLGVGGFLVGWLTTSLGREPTPLPAPSALPSTPEQQKDLLLSLLPAHDQLALMNILRDCGPDTECSHPAIRALLERQPRQVRHQIMQLATRTEPAGAQIAAGWPPAAAAAVVPPGEVWLDWAATVLESAVPLEQARLYLDVADIVRATDEARSGSPEGPEREIAANAARHQMIRALLERDGHQVETRPFSITTRDVQGVRMRFEGRNLLVSFGDDRAGSRTLMLMAHGDMTGAEDGSNGANDNASGVGALLAVARQLRTALLPPGTRVQLLVTDLEERGLIGAQAYVRQCLAQLNCPDVALNVDMLGRGDGLTISGSDQQSLYRVGDALDAPVRRIAVSATEARLAALLREVAHDAGLVVHDSDGWTMQSDHLAFQREALPALGVTLIDAVDVGHERARQQARAALLAADAAVPWDRFDDYVGGRLDAATRAAVEARLDAYDEAVETYRALPHSRYAANIHNGYDQMDQFNPRHAFRAVGVLNQAIAAWLAAPEVNPGD
ncbi:M28 family peptidase [Stenotrophomonas sp.]|uniref:M28 family metallopeptidase n=1 Tax=Stenotrophomonas sp. TaxID=69392 RepID=UPI0028A23E52|nr:M28 family peptidase [Stenotrophomonas sp.]